MELENVGESGDISKRIKVKGDDEIADICRHVNSMLDRLERAQSRLHEERVSAIGDAARMIAHDLRNPLQAILNNIYLIESKIRGSAQGSELAEKLDSIKLEIRYMDKVVSDLYYYGSSLKEVKVKVRVQQIVNDTLSSLNIPQSIKVNVSCEGELIVDAEPTILKRVLSNIVLNAVQAMPEGGTLTVKGMREGDEVVLSVTDTGKGIPEELKDRIFEPLFTTKAKGIGLGLAVSKRLIESLGGRIEFYSKVGEGTTFTIRLPSTA